MPQRKCCVFTCSSSLIEGAVLHAFPNPLKEFERFQAWVTNIGLLREDDDYIFKNRRICHLHFEDIYKYPSHRLNRLAIPTLHLSDANVQPMYEGEPNVEVLQLTTANIDNVPNANVQPMYEGEPNVEVLQLTTASIDNVPRIQFKSLSKTEIDLHNTIAKTQAQLRRCRKSKASLIEKIKIMKKFRLSKAYELVTKDLSPAAQTFFAMQTKQAVRQPKGHRFSLDEKILALALYKPCPKAYRLLSQICILPKKSTLNGLMKKVFLSPGPNDLIFEHLKMKVDKMPAAHKYCTVIFDEMAIAANLFYDKSKDEIKGFCNDGTNKTNQLANHVLVFMLRGVIKKFKLPISYSFCAGTTSSQSLTVQLKIILKKIMDTGLKVVSTTCDQGPTNIAAINLLINETKAAYIRAGKEFRGGFFEIDGIEIYALYDPPHLLKSIRNNMLTKNLTFQSHGRKRIAKWEHLEELYKEGRFCGLRLVPKLTARHVVPHLIPKMKVKYCTQVFSKTVSVALGFAAGSRMAPDCVDTALLLLFFDRLFDSVNGNYNRVISGKIYRSAVTPKSPHFRLWNKSLPILKSMQFIGGRVRVVPSITGWIRTIEAFQQITKKLHNLGLKSLLLRQFNQDPLENFFGAIRNHGARNVMPSAHAFEASYKALLINNLISPKTVGANCESDDGFCLQSLKYFLTQDIQKPSPKELEVHESHLNVNIENIKMIISSDNQVDIERCAAAAYCSGYLINLSRKKIFKDCAQCKNNMIGDSEELFSKFIKMKKYSDKCVLYYPTQNLLEYVLSVEIITIHILKTTASSTQIANYIELICAIILTLNWINCETHKEELKTFISKKSILLILKQYCTEVNHILTGKATVWDESDLIKQSAYNIFKKKTGKIYCQNFDKNKNH